MLLLTLSIIVLGIYDFLFYATLNAEPLEHEPEQWPPITVLTCVRNNEEGIRRLAARLATQNYPAAMQWVVVDDGGSLPDDFNSGLPDSWELTLIHLINKEIPGKKGAVLEGWKHAKHELILSIDADCIPRSDSWMREMARPLINGKLAVLGFGDYELRRGLLNELIQFETSRTAMLYLSSARRAKPYMAVGRNWGYRKWESMEHDLRQDAQTLSGDDDLLLQKRKLKTVGLRWRVEAHTVSDAPDSWSGWIRQKSRHASTGKSYPLGILAYLGMYDLAQIGLVIGLLTALFSGSFLVLSLSLWLAYIIMSTLLRWPFYSTLSKTSHLWKRWYLEPLLLLFMFLWWAKSLFAPKTWNAST